MKTGRRRRLPVSTCSLRWSRVGWVLVLFPLWFTQAAFAWDGPDDNRTDQVRPIPPVGMELPADVTEVLVNQFEALNKGLAAWRESEPDTSESIWPDIAIFPRAVSLALSLQQFYDPQDVERAKQLLHVGRQRLDFAKRGQTPWLEEPGVVFRGFVSALDGTVQPYAVERSHILQGTAGPVPLDVWFHGRGERIAELQFLSQSADQLGVFHPREAMTVFPYGRYCNANKFAGEVDTLEAIEAVAATWNVDRDRVAVRGFSMGGASAWQFAVHYSGQWAVANPGAGFAETPDFLQTFQRETLQPYWWERRLWHWYDATDWAGNLANCPTIAYSGENDVQKQAADIMAKAMSEAGIDLVHVIGPDTAHRYHPESALDVERRVRQLSRLGRPTRPGDVGFTTYTLRYHQSSWLKITGLLEHWQKSSVQAWLEQNQIMVTVDNVTAIELDFSPGTFPFRTPPQIQILHQNNGQWQIATLSPKDVLTLAGPVRSDRSWRIPLHFDGKDWVIGQPEAGLRKKPGLQGPVDDALMGAFLFVQPTGESPWTRANDWSDRERKRAVEQWKRHFRGDVRVKKDTEVTANDRQQYHLILWGDPVSNQEWHRIADRLPIQLKDSAWHVGDQQFAADQHAPIFVYPNPESPHRYVVANSSFTFREYAYLNNARQVPMLPDWAIIDLQVPAGYQWPGGIAAADFFDERWQVKLPIPQPDHVQAPAPVKLPGRN